jgi:hypothetical protein
VWEEGAEIKGRQGENVNEPGKEQIE